MLLLHPLLDIHKIFLNAALLIKILHSLIISHFS